MKYKFIDNNLHRKSSTNLKQILFPNKLQNEFNRELNYIKTFSGHFVRNKFINLLWTPLKSLYFIYISNFINLKE